MIWLVGSAGMLGRLVAAELSAAGLPYHATDIEVDITDPAAIAAGAPRAAAGLGAGDGTAAGASTETAPPEAAAPSWVINCSAYTAVDQAETDQDAAYRLNRDAVANLARYCRNTGARMLHLSTDYVFDGATPSGYAEDAPVNPVSVYGRSKAEGEALLRRELPEHVIVRTAWLYAEHGRNFLLTMLRLLAEREELTVVNDQHGSPTYAGDLARAIVAMVGQDVGPGRAAAAAAEGPEGPGTDGPFGTVHFTNAGVTTWYDFACRIQSEALARGLLQTARTIRPVTTDQYPTAAVRPRYSALRHDRLMRVYGITPRPWHEALADCLDRRAAAAQ